MPLEPERKGGGLPESHYRWRRIKRLKRGTQKVSSTGHLLISPLQEPCRVRSIIHLFYKRKQKFIEAE